MTLSRCRSFGVQTSNFLWFQNNQSYVQYKLARGSSMENCVSCLSIILSHTWNIYIYICICIYIHIYVCVCVCVCVCGYLSMAVFILIHRSHSYRWAAVVPRSNWRSWALSRKTLVQDKVRYWVWPSMGLFKYLHVHHAASHVYVEKKREKRGWGNFP